MHSHAHLNRLKLIKRAKQRRSHLFPAIVEREANRCETAGVGTRSNRDLREKAIINGITRRLT